jgi:hypothetical protein
MKQCCEGDAVNDATAGARNCNNNGEAPSQVHQQILASLVRGRGSAVIQGGYGMERLRPGQVCEQLDAQNEACES